LAVRQPQGGPAVRLDGVDDCLGLAEVHSAGQEGAQGELARPGHASAMTQALLEGDTGGQHAAMNTQFNNVVAGVAMGAGIPCDHGLVCWPSVLVQNFTQVGDSWTELWWERLARANEEGPRNLEGVRPAHPNYRQGCFAGGCCQCGDCVCGGFHYRPNSLKPQPFVPEAPDTYS
jgi:hypothetical protein